MRSSPLTTMPPMIASSWPRLTFLISPLKDTERTAKSSDQAGQIENRSVSPRLKGAPRSAPWALAFAITPWYVPAPSTSSRFLWKLRAPIAPSASTPSVIAMLTKPITTAQRWTVK